MWLELSQFKIKFPSPGETEKEAIYTGRPTESCVLTLHGRINFCNDEFSMEITKKIIILITFSFLIERTSAI